MTNVEGEAFLEFVIVASEKLKTITHSIIEIKARLDKLEAHNETK